MKFRQRSLLCVAAAAAMLAAATAARSQTCTLELKRLDSQDRVMRADYIYRATMPQSFFVQMAPPGKRRGVREPGANVCLQADCP